MDLERYRESEDERARTLDLLRLLPKGRESVLDIGARDGHFSRLLARRFPRVVALDLEAPRFSFPGVETLAGNVANLQFPDDSFDCVFCAEVLEHVPDVARACQEIIRVARHEIVIGVPYKQDIRVGRTTCQQCKEVSPPWGHIHSFDENTLQGLFEGADLCETSFVGATAEVTNPVSTLLMDVAGNPWGSYDQEERCIHCGAVLCAPAQRSLVSRVGSALALNLNRIQRPFSKAHGNWIHLLFRKPKFAPVRQAGTLREPLAPHAPTRHAAQ